MTASSERAGLPLRSAAVLNGTHRLLPAAGPRPRDGCDHRDRHEQHRFLRLTRRSALPGPLTRSPAGTTTSADFCPVSPHLTARAAGAATTTAQPAPRQISPGKNVDFLLMSPAAFTPAPFGRIGLPVLCCKLVRTQTPDSGSCSSARGFRRRLPSDSTSRWTPLPLASGCHDQAPIEDFHLQSSAHAGRTQTSALRAAMSAALASGAALAGSRRSVASRRKHGATAQ